VYKIGGQRFARLDGWALLNPISLLDAISQNVDKISRINAPDLRKRNQPFQSLAFRFKEKRFYKKGNLDFCNFISK